MATTGKGERDAFFPVTEKESKKEVRSDGEDFYRKTAGARLSCYTALQSCTVIQLHPECQILRP